MTTNKTFKYLTGIKPKPLGSIDDWLTIKQVYDATTYTLEKAKPKELVELNIGAKPSFMPIQQFFDTFCMLNMMVGSKYICSPPPQNSDEDHLCLTKDLESALSYLFSQGWKKNGLYSIEDFVSLRHQESNINLILTENDNFFFKFKAAAQICKKLNILNKEMRIYIHKKVLDT